MNFDYDVAVIGAGPAGSTAAALLADKGYRVLVLERERHPRFHIGESLLPLNLPLFDKLGVADRVAALGLVKRGAEFHSQEHGRSLTFPFAEGWPGAPAYAYQVRRSEFDLALLGNARDKGAHVIEGCRVDEVRFDPERVQVIARADEDAALSYSVRYLVDASGRDTFMAGKLKIKHRNVKHASAALYGHFRGARRNSGIDEGNIGIYWFPHGWLWFIPLADGTTSVGAVCWPYYLKTRAADPTTFFRQTLQLCPALWDRVRDAELVAPATATGNYSYTCERMTGDRFVMIGDAFAFVDPVFSSGVYLAMNSAVFATDVVHGALRDPAAALRLGQEFERKVRTGLRSFQWMIYRMTSPIMRDLLMGPRNELGIKSAVISFLAGDVYQPGPVRRRLYAFRVIYYLSALINLRRAWANWRERRRQITPQRIYATDGSG